MVTILTKIQRKILEDNFEFSTHCLFELAEESFSPKDAISAILNAFAFDKLTNDESHTRYAIYGAARDSRLIKVIVFLSQGKVFIKTAYEYFE